MNPSFTSRLVWIEVDNILKNELLTWCKIYRSNMQASPMSQMKLANRELHGNFELVYLLQVR